MNSQDLHPTRPVTEPVVHDRPVDQPVGEPATSSAGAIAVAIIGLTIAAFIILILTGFIRFNVEGTMQAPQVEVTGGSAPSVEVEIGRVGVTTEERTVEVPRLEVERPGEPR
jgi:hypothetical protein